MNENIPDLTKYKKYEEVDFNENWALIQRTVHDYITSVPVDKSTLIQRIEQIRILCTTVPFQYDGELYNETKSFLTNYVERLKEDFKQYDRPVLLKLYYEAWSHYNRGMECLDTMYWYLNQVYRTRRRQMECTISQNSYVGSEDRKLIGNLGLEIWKEYMIKRIGGILVSLILDIISQDRIEPSGEYSSTIIKGSIESFVEVERYNTYKLMELYEETFEKHFVKASAEYFKKESNRIISEVNFSDYMEKVSQLRDEEDLRSEKYLRTSTCIKVRRTFELFMIDPHIKMFYIHNMTLLKDADMKGMALIYRLVKPVPGALGAIVAQVIEYFMKGGTFCAPVKEDQKSPGRFVERIMDFHAKSHKFIKEVFNGDSEIIGALDKACAHYINQNPNAERNSPSSDLLAKYSDSVLRKSTKTFSEKKIEEKLTDVITIFIYINDKDLFIKFYGRMLCKRLLRQHCIEAEESMINQLTKTSGYTFTSKLRQMMKDISISADLNNQFQNYINENNFKLGITFSIKVLRTGSWPISSSNHHCLAVPRGLMTSIQTFENLYQGKFKGRKLTWLHHLSKVELETTYLARKYRLIIPSSQMAIFCLFETVVSLTGKEIQDTLQLDSDQLSKYIAPLIDSNLLKSDTQNILPETFLSLNLEYTNQNLKLNVPLPQDSAPGVKQINMGRIEEERKQGVQALIVRIMKARKTIVHNTLVQEVLSQSNGFFTPTIGLIKKCINHLIDKEYIGRNPESMGEYFYIP